MLWLYLYWYITPECIVNQGHSLHSVLRCQLIANYFVDPFQRKTQRMTFLTARVQATTAPKAALRVPMLRRTKMAVTSRPSATTRTGDHPHTSRPCSPRPPANAPVTLRPPQPKGSSELLHILLVVTCCIATHGEGTAGGNRPYPYGGLTSKGSWRFFPS